MKISRLTGAASHLFLAFLALVSVFPMMLVFINSFKINKDIIKNPLNLSFSAGVQNYIDAWQDIHFARAFLNSFIYSGSTIIVVLFCATLAAYVFAKHPVKGSSLLLLYFLITMTIPVQLFLFPLYSVYARLHLLGNLVAVSLILAALNLPLSILLLRAFFLQVPQELEEAAMIDGANIRQALTKVIIPLVSPGMLTVSVIVGLNSWNEFLVSSTFIQGEQNFTATLALFSFKGVNYANQGFNMAASTILVVPAIVFFLALQKYFIEGIVGGAVKG